MNHGQSSQKGSKHIRTDSSSSDILDENILSKLGSDVEMKTPPPPEGSTTQAGAKASDSDVAMNSDSLDSDSSSEKEDYRGEDFCDPDGDFDLGSSDEYYPDDPEEDYSPDEDTSEEDTSEEDTSEEETSGDDTSSDPDDSVQANDPVTGEHPSLSSQREQSPVQAGERVSARRLGGLTVDTRPAEGAKSDGLSESTLPVPKRRSARLKTSGSTIEGKENQAEGAESDGLSESTLPVLKRRSARLKTGSTKCHELVGDGSRQEPDTAAPEVSESTTASGLKDTAKKAVRSVGKRGPGRHGEAEGGANGGSESASGGLVQPKPRIGSMRKSVAESTRIRSGRRGQEAEVGSGQGPSDTVSTISTKRSTTSHGKQHPRKSRNPDKLPAEVDKSDPKQYAELLCKDCNQRFTSQKLGSSSSRDSPKAIARRSLIKHFQHHHWHKDLFGGELEEPTDSQLEEGTGLILCTKCVGGKESPGTQDFIHKDQMRDHQAREHGLKFMCNLEDGEKIGINCYIGLKRDQYSLKMHYYCVHDMNADEFANLLEPYVLPDKIGQE